MMDGSREVTRTGQGVGGMETPLSSASDLEQEESVQTPPDRPNSKGLRLLSSGQVMASHVFHWMSFADPFPRLGFHWKVGVMVIMTIQ